jgi:hypothetical protein
MPFELGGVSLLGNPWLDLGLLLLVGFVTGIINTMAGGGGFLILPVLVGMGLPVNVANGSVRVSVLTQNIGAVATFHNEGVRAYRPSWQLGPAMIVGALAGAYLATKIDNDIFKPLVGVVLLAWALILLIKPERFLRPPDQAREPNWLTQMLALLTGFYGGFLQAGVGFPLIALLTGHLGYDLVKANSIKVTLVLAYTIFTLPLFIGANQIAWAPALVLALTTMLGAWVGARWQLQKGAEVVRWFVLAMVTISGALMLASLFR